MSEWRARRYDIYVCNLAPATTVRDLREHFAASGFPLGELVWIVRHDRKTGAALARPFANIQLDVPEHVNAFTHRSRCIAAMECSNMLGREICVKEFGAKARPRASYHSNSPLIETWARSQAGTTNEVEQ